MIYRLIIIFNILSASADQVPTPFKMNNSWGYRLGSQIIVEALSATAQIV